MKRILQVLLIVVCCSAISFGQQKNLGYARMDQSNAQQLRQGEMECPPESLFGQPAINPCGGYFCDANDVYQYTEVIEDYPALSGDIGKVTFWVGFYDRISASDCTPGAPATDSYAISFYAIDGTNPSYPGALVRSFTLSPTLVQNLGVSCFTVYRLEFTLPENIGPNAGWIGIGRLTRTDNCILMWDVIENGYQYSGKQRHQGILEDTGLNFPFCLGTGQNVPISNWAIIVGVVLIGTFVFIRYRRMV
jgi:hypothetical protein